MGQADVDRMQAEGAMAVQGMEFGRQESILGMASGRMQAANEARQRNTEMWANLGGQALSAAGSVASAGMGS